MHGVPDSFRPSQHHRGGSPAAAPGPRPIEAVLFDFHGTLAQVEDPIRWVTEAAAACGESLHRTRATVLADRLLTAGRPGGPRPYRIPPHLAEVWAERDLYPSAHRAAYTGLTETVASGIDGLDEALYDRVLDPEGWIAYADALPVLGRLRAAGIPTAVVSNIGFDLRPILAKLGLSDLLDALVLSFEVGRVKPDPTIFTMACASLRVDPERTLMVGDTPADAGAGSAGCVALVLPESPPAAVHGLSAVLNLVGTRR
ncbi:MAG: HAD-IA family hydrolase [Micromonosporaceae bacterium]|nr:HAD-IA family hydrolase [Micromonosporaceae bacterium]